MPRLSAVGISGLQAGEDVNNAVKHVWGKAAVGSMAAYSIPLYTLPGAKGEDK